MTVGAYHRAGKFAVTPGPKVISPAPVRLALGGRLQHGEVGRFWAVGRSDLAVLVTGHRRSWPSPTTLVVVVALASLFLVQESSVADQVGVHGNGNTMVEFSFHCDLRQCGECAQLQRCGVDLQGGGALASRCSSAVHG